MKKLFHVLYFFLIFSAFIFSQPDTLTILHVNDSHSTLEAIGPRDSDLKGTMGGISRVATLAGMTKMTEPNVLFLHAGDISIGDVFFNKNIQVPELRLLSGIGLDAMTLGNHEFDLGPTTLLNAIQIAFSEAAPFPILTANVDFSDPAIAELEDYVDAYTIKEFGDLKVGIFGLTTPATNLLSMPAPAVVSEDIFTIAATMVATLQAMDCDVIILLSHLGVALDQMIGSNIPGIDVIVGGHDHYKFEEALAVTNPAGKTTWIVQARSNYMYAGKMSLVVDGDDIMLSNYELIPVNSDIPANEEVQTIVDGLVEDIESAFGIPFYTAPMGYANTYFEEEALNLLSPGSHDTPAGNLVADAFRAYTSTDIALQAGGSIALPLWEGTFTPGDLFRLNGYGFNTTNYLGFQLATFDLTGTDILTGLEFGLSEIEMNDEFMLQVSGMEYTYNSMKPAWERLVSVKVNGMPLDPAAIYSVTANEIVLSILDYVGITPVSLPQILTDVTEFQALSEYVMAQDNFLTAKTIGRVMNVGDQTAFGGIMGAGWMDLYPVASEKTSSAFNKLFFEFHLADFGLNFQPKGKVNLRIPHRKINFKSDFCEWLIIEDNTATLKGTGQINNKGSFGFMLVVENGAVHKTGSDKLRVIIWDINDGDKIIYDNLILQQTHGVIVLSRNSLFAKDMIEYEEVIPADFALEQNYPNPFNPSTKISWQSPVGSHQTLKVYDILGNEVATLVDEYREAGRYEVDFNPASSIRHPASGIYFYQLKVGDPANGTSFVETKKMLLIK